MKDRVVQTVVTLWWSTEDCGAQYETYTVAVDGVQHIEYDCDTYSFPFVDIFYKDGSVIRSHQITTVIFKPQVAA